MFLVCTLFFASLLLSSSFLCINVFASNSNTTGTYVQGTLWDNTTWTAKNSPYIVSNTVEIPSNATLTIEAGVTVTSGMSGSAPLFLVNGTVIADGTVDNEIVFDGRGNANFFQQNSDSAFINLSYCTIRNGDSFLYQGHGSFSLSNSLLDTLCYQSIIRSQQDIYMVNNTFVSTAGFYVETSTNIYMDNNLVTRNAGPLITMGDGSAILRNNSFVNINGYLLKLSPESNYANPTIDAASNYWGTTNTTLIDSMLYDEHNDPSCNGLITYLPILQVTDSSTPPDTYNLTIYTIGDGTVVPDNSTYFAYSTVNLSAHSAQGWSFNGWSGDASGNGNTTLIMDSNKNVTATFTEAATSTNLSSYAAIVAVFVIAIAVIPLVLWWTKNKTK